MKIVLTRTRAAVIVTVCYAGAAWAAGLLFRFVEWSGGYDDGRDEQATLLYAVVIGTLWLGSLARIWRS